jgi:UDP-glucose 4-epimerase
MRTVVFGGSGFLGSHVADELTARGHDVRIFDLTPSPYLRDGQEMIVGDILDADAVQAAVDGCDYVYNFAGIADLDDATTRPLDTVMLNVVGNIDIMQAALKAGVTRFVYASSIYVYSQKGGFYRCSKQASELYLEEYQRRYGLEFTVLRYGTLFGPRADERNSIYRYMRQAVEDKRIVCVGTGDEVREYIHVRDAARLSVDVLADEYRNRHIILSGHNPIKFREMLMMIDEILGGGVDITFEAAESPSHYRYTPYSYAPSIGEKLVSHLYVDVGQGLLECLGEMYGPGEGVDGADD